jgi:hypothetical protein
VTPAVTQALLVVVVEAMVATVAGGVEAAAAVVVMLAVAEQGRASGEARTGGGRWPWQWPSDPGSAAASGGLSSPSASWCPCRARTAGT